ncbi:MAG: hypothetical protein DRQ54_08180 [Gammaproteobacteria bacterium]|nr:MAG: hypothetical protein DRQ54_08180 [Gammaproteobacteria bacterium]RLA11724.1 MAG: hypothetical protein DRQ52_09115 [Gammaproteobacteria bacterium]
MNSARQLVAICSLALISWSSLAADEKPLSGTVIAGWLERVTFPGHDFQIRAKLDTGAKTSSIHAIDITEFTRDGERWVSYTLPLEDIRHRLHKLIMENPIKRNVLIKNHDGNHDNRPIVTLEFCFNGQLHQADFSLTDRSQFHYPMLLGRRFLGGTAMVDASRTFTTQGKCP